MNCHRAHELIIDALVEPLGANDTALLRQHLEGCRECANDTAQYHELWGDLAMVAVPRPPANALATFHAKLQEEIGAAAPDAESGSNTPAGRDRDAQGAVPWMTWLKRAAAVVLLVGLGTVLTRGYDMVNAPTEPSAPEGRRFMLVMTATQETPELADQLNSELSAWVASIREQGTIEQIIRMPGGPSVGGPSGRTLMADDTAGIIIIRVATEAEARSIAAASPVVRYGGLIEVRAMN